MFRFLIHLGLVLALGGGRDPISISQDGYRRIPTPVTE